MPEVVGHCRDDGAGIRRESPYGKVVGTNPGRGDVGSILTVAPTWKSVYSPEDTVDPIESCGL